MELSMNVVVMLYLVASVFFIQALKGLSHPTTSRRGNTFGMVGMAIAMVTTIALVYKLAPQMAWIGALRRALPDDVVIVDELTQIGYVARVVEQHQDHHRAAHPVDRLDALARGLLGIVRHRGDRPRQLYGLGEARATLRVEPAAARAVARRGGAASPPGQIR